MTFAPEAGVSTVDPSTDLGRFPLEFSGCCRARLDRTAVRTVGRLTRPPPGPGSRAYRQCDEQGDLSSGHICKRHFSLLPKPDGLITRGDAYSFGRSKGDTLADTIITHKDHRNGDLMTVFDK